MATVTDLNFYMENKLKEKLDICIDRSTGNKRMDNLWIVDGDEGYGKSTFTLGAAYYVAHEMKRSFSMDNIFFDIDSLIKFTKSTEEQVIVWDEAALGGLSTDWRSKSQIQLTKLLMTVRKKRHFMFFCIPKFFKLNEYILIDRAIALVHVYARNETQIGRFCYYNKKSKENLFYARLKTKMRLYRKYHTLHGSFPNVLSKIIDEKAYDKKKDEAIMSIGVKETPMGATMVRYNNIKYKFYNSDLPKSKIAEIMGVTPQTISSWKKLKYIEP